MILAISLSVLVGVSLGLLGGGGSILTVPILVYGAGLEPRDAIAASLLIVGATSAVAVLGHARAGCVAWRAGSLMGITSMLGAYVGGRAAHLVSGRSLLLAFTAMMFATGMAMLRPRAERPGRTKHPHGTGAVAWSAAVGLAIGGLTGLVGAGGGFIIVPALVLFGGLSVRTAIGTSLLVIAMNAFAGFVGAVAHASIPWALVIAATGASMAGGVGGVALTARVRPEALRASFAWWVVAMACFMVFKQSSSLQFHGESVMTNFTPGPALVGGALIGASASMLLAFNGRIAGIAGIVGGVLPPYAEGPWWRVMFLVGLLVGGLLLLLVDPAAFGSTPVSGPLVVASGLLVGFGTRLGNGCTSGHGVCGVARGSRRSIAATMTFMVTAMAAAFVVQHALGGGR